MIYLPCFADGYFPACRARQLAAEIDGVNGGERSVQDDGEDDDRKYSTVSTGSSRPRSSESNWRETAARDKVGRSATKSPQQQQSATASAASTSTATAQSSAKPLPAWKSARNAGTSSANPSSSPSSDELPSATTTSALKQLNRDAEEFVPFESSPVPVQPQMMPVFDPAMLLPPQAYPVMQPQMIPQMQQMPRMMQFMQPQLNPMAAQQFMYPQMYPMHPGQPGQYR